MTVSEKLQLLQETYMNGKELELILDKLLDSTLRRVQQNKYPAAEAASRCQQRIPSERVDELNFESA